MDEEKQIIEHKEFTSLPTISIEDMKQITAYVNNLKKALMVEGKDYIIRGDKQYTSRSGFAKLAQGFNLSDEILEKEEIYYPDMSWRGWRFTVRVFNQVGRQATGVGAATIDEPNIANKKERPYHDCYATAYTRAWNRAVSNFVGSADVSVEEMGYDNETQDSPRQAKDVKVKVVDYVSPKGFELPEWLPADELNRSEDSWDNAKEIAETWMKQAGFNTEQWKYYSDDKKLTVRPAKEISLIEIGTINGILLDGGFINKRNVWRIDRKGVTG